MQISTTIFLCICTFAIAVNTSAYAFDKENFPLNWYDMAGWLAFAVAFILWDIAKR